MKQNVLNTLIKQSYHLPNGHKLRQACLQYSYVHNNYKTAVAFNPQELYKTVKDLDDSPFGSDGTQKPSLFGNLTEAIVSSEIERLNQEQAQAIAQNMLDRAKQQIQLQPQQVNQAPSLPIESPVVNPQKVYESVPPEVVQDAFEEHITSNPEQSPFLSELLSHSEVPALVFTALAIAFSLYQQNPRKAKLYIQKAVSKVKNIGKILFKVLSTSYRWLSNNVSKVLPKLMNFVPAEQVKQKLVDLFRKNLHLSRTARLNLIRVAYQADYRLGQYAVYSL